MTAKEILRSLRASQGNLFGARDVLRNSSAFKREKLARIPSVPGNRVPNYRQQHRTERR